MCMNCQPWKKFRKVSAQRKVLSKSENDMFQITTKILRFEAFKITATNILNRYDLWPNIDLFVESHVNTLQLVKISSIRQIQTSPLPPSSSWFYSSKALCTLK